MREKLNIPDELLHACLREQYGISAVVLDFLPLGLDTNSAVYRVLGEDERAYLLKVRRGTLYEASCLVPRYLRDQGITGVVAPLRTKRQGLWVQAEEWTLIVYPFIEGETGFKLGMAEEHWREAGTILRQIHQVKMPVEGFPSIRKETFAPGELCDWVRDFEARLVDLEDESESERALQAYWLANRATIHRLVEAMEELGGLLREQCGPTVICHADLHGNNMLCDLDGHVFIIDWDDAMLAPKERDFIFVREGQVDSTGKQETGPCFQGYGETEIDWRALTYYRYERVVQDTVACAQEVFFRADLGAESKSDAAELFGRIFREGDMVDMGRAAAAHLPAQFGILRQKQ